MKVSGGNGASVRGKLISCTLGIILVLGSLVIGIVLEIPNVCAGMVDHDVGDIDINMLTDYGRILGTIAWNGTPQTVSDPATGCGFFGLVVDQDNYNHVPGAVDIAESFSFYPYVNVSDLAAVDPITMVIDNASTQKSVAAFENTGTGTGDPNDITINQTCWTLADKDWAIIQWTMKNVKNTTLSGMCIGLELSLSQSGALYGVGGDSGDDIDGYDIADDIYWVQDNSGTTLGFGSALVLDPIDHYYSKDYHADYGIEYRYYYENETWLYNRLHASNSVVGATPGNRSSTVGWGGITLSPGELRTVTLVIAINDTFDTMKTAFKDAQNYYQTQMGGFLITEFSDDSTTQRIEVYNNGLEPTDLAAAGFSISVDGGASFVPGTWTPQVIPTYGYSVFQPTGTPLPEEGGSISLHQFQGGNHILVDGPFMYGQEGTVPDPLDGESVARRYDTVLSAYTDEWLRNASSGPTWGAQNNVGHVVHSPQVVLNRVMFNPFSPSEYYVELMYKSQGTVDMSGYRIVCDDEFIVPLGITIGSDNKFFVLTYALSPTFFTNMDTSGDNVYLYDDNGNLLDMVGWSSSHTQGYFMSRMPDGNGTFDGFNDTSSIAAGWIFDQRPSMLITEFSPDSEQVEVFNPRGGDKVPGAPGTSTWKLRVAGGDLIGAWSLDPIPCGSYLVFTRTGGAPMDIEGDVIELVFTESITVETVSFGTRGPAPDPLYGESTGRWWNGSANAYSNDWNRNASSGPTWGAQNDVPPIDPTPDVVLNELMFYPNAGDGYYIVLYNLRNFEIDMGGWELVCDNVFRLPAYTLPAFAPLIIRYDDFGGGLHDFFDNMTAAGDNVYLYDDDGKRLDMVGWHTSHLQGMSVRRVPDGFGTYDGYDDTSSEAAGWVFDSPLQVLMTEISDSGGTAQIEVFNPWYPTIDFTLGGYSIENKSGVIAGIWSIEEADAGEYAVFDVTTPNGLAVEGDSINLYQNGIPAEHAGYGQYGTIPDPLDGESVERCWDGAEYSEVWERNWSTGPSFGAQNDVPEPYINLTVMLNEVLFNPTNPGDFFVEIYNSDLAPMNISGWKIVGDTEYIIPDILFPPVFPNTDSFFYFNYSMDPVFFDFLDCGGDNIYLYTDNGSLVDMVGWSSPHVQGESMYRYPDGNGTRNGYDDTSSRTAGWFFNSTPSPPPLHPAPPKGLSARLVSNCMDVMLSWNASDDDGKGDNDVAGYTVYKSNTGFNGSYDFIDWIFANGSSSYNWTNIGAGDGDCNNYFYKVRANDTSNNEEQNNETAGKFVNHLVKDWNLVSVPLIQFNTSMKYVLHTIEDNLIAVQRYHAGKSRPWLHWHKAKPPYFNDVIKINHTEGYYIKMLNPDYLVVAGTVPNATHIPLKTGWNLIGYPCLINKTRDDALSSIAGKYNRVEYYDPVKGNEVRLGPDDYMHPGLGYWVHATEDCILII